jgi:hypothetical protein
MFGFFGKPSKKAFAKIVLRAARRAGVTGDFIFDEPDFTLRKEKARIFLGNLFADYCRANRARQEMLLRNFVSGMLPMAPQTRDDALGSAVAVVRERALISFTDLRSQTQGMDPLEVAFEPISEWFGRCIVLDAPGSMRMVTKRDLKEWGLTFEELFAVGLERLRAATQPKFQAENGFLIGLWNDDYDSSRILLPELFRELAINGDPVFCLPNRLTLMVAGSADPEAAAAMMAKAEEIVQNGARRQNPSPLTYRGNHLTDFTIGVDSPLATPVQRANGISGLMYYDEQAQVLNALHEKTGKDIFVAKFKLNEVKSGGYCSYAVWSRDVLTLLPQTDFVIFFDPVKPEPERILGWVKWADVKAVADDLMLDTEMFPARFYVSGFPSAAQLEAMPKHRW